MMPLSLAWMLKLADTTVQQSRIVFLPFCQPFGCESPCADAPKRTCKRSWIVSALRAPFWTWSFAPSWPWLLCRCCDGGEGVLLFCRQSIKWTQEADIMNTQQSFLAGRTWVLEECGLCRSLWDAGDRWLVKMRWAAEMRRVVEATNNEESCEVECFYTFGTLELVRFIVVATSNFKNPNNKKETRFWRFDFGRSEQNTSLFKNFKHSKVTYQTWRISQWPRRVH